MYQISTWAATVCYFIKPGGRISDTLTAMGFIIRKVPTEGGKLLNHETRGGADRFWNPYFQTYHEAVEPSLRRSGDTVPAQTRPLRRPPKRSRCPMLTRWTSARAGHEFQHVPLVNPFSARSGYCSVAVQRMMQLEHHHGKAYNDTGNLPGSRPWHASMG